jgi:hypothetical protein
MIWHPASLALLVASGAALALMLLALPVALRVLRFWDGESSSERQFALERATVLLSTLAALAVGVNVASLFLFIATAEAFSHTLAGAMCATGTLNASPAGWAVLATKGAVLVAGSVWLALNSVDNASPASPLIRLKYGALVALLPLFALDFVLLASFLSGLKPDIVTSCCGSLFSSAAGRPQSVLAALPPKPVMRAFAAAAAGIWALGLLCAARGTRLLYGLYAAAAAAHLAFGLVAVISFIAPHVYRLPTHHCPFDLFQRAYGFVGYPLLGSLAATAVCGLLPGLFLPLQRHPSLEAQLRARMRRWVRLSLVYLAVFDGVTYWHVWREGLVLYP